MQRLRLPLVLLVLLAGFVAPAAAAPRAVIVVGLAASDAQAARLQRHAHALREGFVSRGVLADAITVLGANGERVRRDAVLAALQPPVIPRASAAADNADAETWIVLLGTASTRAAAGGAGREPSFQISGPRLTATDLAAAVKALPGRRFVVVATSASGGFLPPLLALPGVEAVAATADSGEVNEPRFAEAWAEALLANPRATFAELATAAAARVAAFYETASLAQGEHARLIDRAGNRILEAPFSSVPPATVAGSVSDPTPAFSVADIEIPRPTSDTEIERRPATDETRALLAEAREAAKDSEHAALYLRIDAEYVIDRDFSVIERHRTRAYLRTGEALDDLGTLMLPSSPPHYVTRLEGVRILTPDGAQVLVNPRAFDERRAADRRETDTARAEGRPAGPTAPPFLPLPEVTAGCLIEAAWTVERRATHELPEFSEIWSLAKRYPVRTYNVSVTSPRGEQWTLFAPNLPLPALNDHTSTWHLADLPAFNPRPGDPPAARFAPWVGVSSLASWDAFAAWYRRIASGSDATGPAVEALAADIATAHPDRAGRLRAAYERVAALRYVAVELGVGAFRPRTPEQVWTQRYGDCKDKANLLVAVLTRLGIPAEFALVNRFGHTFTEWPAWQFNHALARVPAAPDAGQPHDLWLDTTDRLVPFGVIAPGNLGRHALAFNSAGTAAAFHEITGIQEPPSRWKEQWTLRNDDRATLTLSADGAATVELRHLFRHLTPAQRQRRLQSLYSQNGFTVTRIVAGDPHDLTTPFVVIADVTLLRDTPPAPFTPPGLADFFATETITQPIYWNEGRATSIVRVDGQILDLPAGPITPEAYPALRSRYLTFTR